MLNDIIHNQILNMIESPQLELAQNTVRRSGNRIEGFIATTIAIRFFDFTILAHQVGQGLCPQVPGVCQKHGDGPVPGGQLRRPARLRAD